MLFTVMLRFCTIFDHICNIVYEDMKRVVFTISEELVETIELAIHKFGFATRAEFYRHSALFFLQQAGLLGGQGLQETSKSMEDMLPPKEQISEHAAYQKELAEFLMKYNEEHDTDLPLPLGYKESQGL